MNKITENNFLLIRIALREGRQEMGEATYHQALEAIKYFRKQMLVIEKSIANAEAEGFRKCQEVERELNGY